jgi:hypothetical protein
VGAVTWSAPLALMPFGSGKSRGNNRKGKSLRIRIFSEVALIVNGGWWLKKEPWKKLSAQP